LGKSQAITDSMIAILGSFDNRLSTLETAIRPTQVRCLHLPPQQHDRKKPVLVAVTLLQILSPPKSNNSFLLVPKVVHDSRCRGGSIRFCTRQESRDLCQDHNCSSALDVEISFLDWVIRVCFQILTVPIWQANKIQKNNLCRCE
jgi:hypothetical protein